MSGGVLCISAGAVARLYHAVAHGWFCTRQADLDNFRHVVNRGAHFVPRERAEHDLGYVQLIPSCAIVNGAKILCLERSPNSARSELKSKWTSLFGGHVDESDNCGTNWQTIVCGVKREIQEELGIHINGDIPEFAGLAIDPTNHSGRLHIGVVFCYRMKRNRIRLSHGLDLDEFNVASGRTVRFLSPAKLYRLQSQFDPWTTLFLKSDFAKALAYETEQEGMNPPLLRAMRA